MTKHDLRHFRTLFLAGERCDPDTLLWAREHLNVPVIDHWWQTETGWAIAANCVGLGMLPVKPGSPTKAVPGYDVRVLSEENQEMPAGPDRLDRDQAAHAARAVCRRCGTTTPASRSRTSSSTPASISPATPAIATRTATSTS